MGWKRTEHQRFRTLGIRAAAGEPSDAPPADVVEDVLTREIKLGTIPADEAASWRRHLTADFAGALDALAERERQLRDAMGQAANRNGALHVSGEQLVASAITAGKFTGARREFWLRRYRDNPEATRATIEALQPVPEFIAGKGKTDNGASAIAAVDPRAAARLGHEVVMPHPLRPGDMPGRVLKPPPEGRVHHAVDRS